MPTAALLVAPAFASSQPAAPGPTATVTTSVAGHALPMSPVHATWQEGRRGYAAGLIVSGDSVSGASTDVAAEWTSACARFHPGTVFRLVAEDAHDQVVPALADGSSRMTMQMRECGKPWSRTFDGTSSARYPKSDLHPTFTVGYGVGVTVSMWGTPTRIQFRVQLQDHFTDTAQVDQSLRVRFTPAG